MVKVIIPDKPDLVGRISARVDAASQFLIIVMGLGLTNGVTKFGEDLSKQFTFSSTLLFVVFVFYAVRFFINNWIYLSQSYREDLLLQENTEHLYTILRCSHLDLLLSIITGASCAFAGTMLFEANNKGGVVVPILILLIFHFAADFAILLHNWWVRHEEGRRDKSIEITFLRIMAWLINNAVFAAIFLLFVILVGTGVVEPVKITPIFSYAWLLNNLIAVAITVCFGRYEITLERRSLRTLQ